MAAGLTRATREGNAAVSVSFLRRTSLDTLFQ